MIYIIYSSTVNGINEILGYVNTLEEAIKVTDELDNQNNDEFEGFGYEEVKYYSR
jgi:hypothetical protein